MATPTTSVSEYCSAMIRSKLVLESDVSSLWRKWQSEGGTDTDVDGFRKHIIREKILTEYQAALIQRGRADGFLVGEYIIVDRIGRGQTAGVYKAVHKSGQVVALKVLAASKSRDQHVLNRFLREGRLLTQLDHPNVVRAYQVGQESGVHFIVMEHVEGETLDEILERRKKLPTPEAVRLLQQAFQGLQHLHEKRMVHRDLKPANLMLTQAGKADTLDATLKILDIGLGRELFDESAPNTQDLQLTGEGALLGTPDYLAPEQARDARSADIRADIYSLGCVLYHLLTGQPPFQDRNVMAQMIAHATAIPKQLAEWNVAMPAGLQGVMDRLLAKKPDDRYSNPADAAQALSPFLPNAARQAEKVNVLPAYRQWLESESAFELPMEVKAALPAAPVAKAIPIPAAPTPTAGTPMAKPLQPAGKPIKPGTDPAPALPFPAAATAPGRPYLPPAPALPAVAEPSINVELVEWPAPVPPVPGLGSGQTRQRGQPLPPPLDEEPDEVDEKSAFELGRRDFVMMGIGSVAVLLAVGFGYALSRLTARKKPEEDPTESTESK